MHIYITCCLPPACDIRRRVRDAQVQGGDRRHPRPCFVDVAVEGVVLRNALLPYAPAHVTQCNTLDQMVVSSRAVCGCVRRRVASRVNHLVVELVLLGPHRRRPTPSGLCTCCCTTTCSGRASGAVAPSSAWSWTTRCGATCWYCACCTRLSDLSFSSCGAGVGYATVGVRDMLPARSQ